MSQSFTYVATATGEHTFTLTSATDQGISVRTTCTDSATELGCADLVAGGEDEVLTVDLTLAQSVTIIVASFFSGDEGPFSVTIDTP